MCPLRRIRLKLPESLLTKRTQRKFLHSLWSKTHGCAICRFKLRECIALPRQNWVTATSYLTVILMHMEILLNAADWFSGLPNVEYTSTSKSSSVWNVSVMGTSPGRAHTLHAANIVLSDMSPNFAPSKTQSTNVTIVLFRTKRMEQNTAHVICPRIIGAWCATRESKHWRRLCSIKADEELSEENTWIFNR